MTQTAVLSDQSAGQAVESRQPAEGRVEIASALLALQGAMYTVAAIEATVVAAGLGNAAGFAPAVLSLGWALGLFWSGTRLRKHRGWKRVKVLELAVLVWAGIDLVLAMVLSNTGLGLLPTLTRIFVPVSVIGLLRIRKGQS